MNGRIVAAAVLALAGCGPATAAPSAAPDTTARVVAAIPHTADCTAQAGKADAHCTPGALNPTVTQANISTTVCRKGWTATVRPPTAVTEKIKRERMAAYGYAGQDPRLFELDHAVPLELGGAPDSVDNLWPEQYAGQDGAHTKDREENALRAAVCAGRLTLQGARNRIVADWTHR